MHRMQIVFGVGIVLVLGASAAWQFRADNCAPAPPVSEPTTTRFDTPASLDIQEVSITPVNYPIQKHRLPSLKGIVSRYGISRAHIRIIQNLWQKAPNEINRLSELLTIATSSAMILSIGIENQYELLGDGKNNMNISGARYKQIRKMVFPGTI